MASTVLGADSPIVCKSSIIPLLCTHKLPLAFKLEIRRMEDEEESSKNDTVEVKRDEKL